MSWINVRLVPGGKLIARRWNSKIKQYEDTDATSRLFYHFDDEVVIEDGVTFKDLMLLVYHSRNILSPLFTKGPDTLEKILDEGLNTPSTNSNLEYLELSWRVSVDSFGEHNTTDFHKWVSFDGVGKPEDNAAFKDWPADKPVTYALDFTPTYELAPLPLKLNPTFKVYDERNGMAEAPVLFEAASSFTLYEMLHGAFWELSFHGDPDSRNSRLEELNQSIEEIESGEAEMIPWEEVKAELKRKRKEIENRKNGVEHGEGKDE